MPECHIIKSLEFEGVPQYDVFDDASNSERASYLEFENKFIERKSF